MEHVKERINVDLTLPPEDAQRLKRFLRKTGRKMVPFVRSFILEVLEDWERENGLSAESTKEMKHDSD